MWARNKLSELFSVDIRSLAVLRISLGLLILFDLTTRLRFLVVFYSDIGVLPRSLVAGEYPLSALSIHMLSGSAGFQVFLFTLAGLFGVMLLVGYRTWLATLGSWVLLASLHLRNWHILDGGDRLLLLLLVWGLFLPLGERWSLDARRSSIPVTRCTVLSIGSAAILIQLGLVYFFAGVLKLYGSEWRDGTALYWVMSYDYWARSFSLWLRSFPEMVLASLTYAVLCLEILGPLLLFTPFWTVRLRKLAIILFLVFQIGLAVSLEVWLFPIISSVALLPFVSGDLWDWVENRLRKRGVTAAEHPASPRLEPRAARLGARRRSETGKTIMKVRTFVREGLAAIVLAYICISNVESMLSDWLLPNEIQRVAWVLGVEQGWGMYAPSPYYDNFRLVTRGTLSDSAEVLLDGGGEGTSWEVVARLRTDYRAKIYLAWVADAEQQDGLREYTHWICRRWNAAYGDIRRIRAVRVSEVVTAIYMDARLVQPKKTTLRTEACPAGTVGISSAAVVVRDDAPGLG